MQVLARSRIVHAAIHARGALVTRAVELPGALPEEGVDVVIPQVTPLADPGSVRAEIEGAREVVAVHASLHLPDGRATPGQSVRAVQALERRIARARAEHDALVARRERLEALSLAPRLTPPLDPVEARIGDALAASTLVSELCAELDERAAALARELDELRHALDAASLEDAQRTTPERMGTGHPTRQITVRLAGEGPVEALRIIYRVDAARWWPVYTLRLSDGGAHAAWWFEALVAQRTGEDWSGASVALSTADLVHDARLPELPSLRLGRAQRAARKAYRPPPEGLERLFEGFDRAFPAEEARATGAGAILLGGAKPMPPAPLPPLYPEPMADLAAAPAAPSELALEELEEGNASFDSDGASDGLREAARARSGAAPPSGGGAAMASFGAAPTAKKVAAPMMARAMVREKERAAPMAPGARSQAAPSPGIGIEPADAWLDFDTLTLADARHPRRGRLVRLAGGPPDGAAGAGELEALAPTRARDPRETRGLFDHRWDAAGAADVPSDGRTHRVTVAVAEAAVETLFRAVPREAPEVYREARLKNPFSGPLLAGPVDVYVEGSLLLTSDIDRIDAGGDLTVGLGVEERLRVSRNARVSEDSAGLLGGSTLVESEISIDLTSSLGREARVELLDRLPITDEDSLKIELVSSSPTAAPYDQRDRGTPVRKGLRWSVALAPAGKARVQFRYTLTFSSKSEIVGGNRRE